MSNYLLSYDLSKPNRNYEDLHKFLRSQVNWANALESVWFVQTSLSALDFAKEALKHMDADDHLLVTPVSGSPAWYNLDPKVETWLEETKLAA
ncbi:MAG: SinR [Mycobacterium sp.]|nr:SinR [Mycobacterium sp.]